MSGGEPVGMPVKRAGNPGRTYPLARKCTLGRRKQKSMKENQIEGEKERICCPALKARGNITKRASGDQLSQCQMGLKASLKM